MNFKWKPNSSFVLDESWDNYMMVLGKIDSSGARQYNISVDADGNGILVKQWETVSCRETVSGSVRWHWEKRYREKTGRTPVLL